MKASTYIVMRYAVLPEDEGREHMIKGYETLTEAKAWIVSQKAEYFKPTDYYIAQISVEER